MDDLLDSHRPTRRTAVASAMLAVGAVGVIAALSMTGSAQADRPPQEITIDSGFPLPTFFTVPPPTFVGTLPPDLTFVTVTFFTLPPGSTTTTDSTTTTPETTTTLETTTSTTSTTTTTEVGGPAQPSADPVYTLEIGVAQINCDGTIHVEYTTTADPAPATAANHIVMYNPASLPTEFHVVETPGNPANGSFVFDELGAVDQTYRLFVIALFDPLNPDGPKVIDQADLALVNGC